MIVWITKYALTLGINQLEVEKRADSDMVIGKTWNDHYHGEGREWHRTYESALAKAEEMRLKKIESLKKQLAKYEEMRFEDKTQNRKFKG